MTREFLANTVELVSGIHQTVPQAMADINTQLAQLLNCADDLGVEVFRREPIHSQIGDQQLSEKGSYREIIERTQY